MQMNNPYQPMPMMNNYNPQFGAYNYNPMANMQRYQQPESVQPASGVSGRVVQAVENINANEVPMDGSIAYFPKQDLSEIYAKSWNADGTIKTIVYKPCIDANGNNHNNLSLADKKSKFDLSDESTELFMSKFDELSGKIEQLESRFDKTLGSQRKTSRSQKDGDD